MSLLLQLAPDKMGWWPCMQVQCCMLNACSSDIALLLMRAGGKVRKVQLILA